MAKVWVLPCLRLSFHAHTVPFHEMRERHHVITVLELPVLCSLIRMCMWQYMIPAPSKQTCRSSMTQR